MRLGASQDITGKSKKEGNSMKKTLALILALMLSIGMLSIPAMAEDGVITVCIGGQPETVDPHMNSASDGSNYIKHMFEGLLAYDVNGAGIVLAAAESYEVSEDGLTWTFKIRPDAKWSDGVDLTAADFEYSFKRFVDPDTAAPYAADMGKFLLNGADIVVGDMPVDELGVKAIDEKTLEVKLAGPCAFFEDIMAFPTYYPIRKDMVEANGAAWSTKPETIIGNGAYKMESWTMDSEIVMVPSETYYNVSELKNSKLVFKLIEDPNAKLAAIRNQEIYWTDDGPTEEIEAAKAEGLFFIEPQLGTYYINFNHNKAPFDNALVRKAFVLALDTHYLSEVVANSVYLPADNFVGGGFYEADGTTEYHAYATLIDRSDYEANKLAAQEALAEAGYPNGEGLPTIEYCTNVASVHLATAEAMIYMWKEVLGVNVELTTMDWGVFTAARRNGEHWMARDGWVADYNDPSTLLNLFKSGSDNNTTFYANAEVDELLNAVDASSDQAERMAKMHEAEAIIFGEDYAACPVYYYATFGLARPEIKGVTTYPTGEKLFHNAVIEG
jgi:oligopeptide transport system substrate-binding protein